MSEELMAALSMIGTLVLMVAVFAGAYFVTRWVARRQQGPGGSAAGNIEVLDRKSIGRDQHLLLVRVGDKTLLVGATAHAVQKIEEVDPAQLHFEKRESPAGKVDFMAVLKDAFKKENNR